VLSLLCAAFEHAKTFENASYAEVGDPDNLEDIFRTALAVLRSLREEGFAPKNIDADFTSGTKPMTSGLVLAATAFGCQTLSFVSGRREHGTVASGTEQFRGIPPRAVTAYQRLSLGEHLLQALQFDAARQVLPEQLAELDDYDRRRGASIRAVADAFDAWDKFDHGSFAKAYNQVDWSIRELGPFKLSDTVRQCVPKMACSGTEGPSNNKRSRASNRWRMAASSTTAQSNAARFYSATIIDRRGLSGLGASS